MKLNETIEKESLEKIISIANAIINENINPVKGCREIDNLRGNTRYSDDKVFIPFLLVKKWFFLVFHYPFGV